MESKDSKSSNAGSNMKLDLGALTSPSRVYIVEHFTALILLALLVVSGIGLFNSLVDHFMSDPQNSLGFGFPIVAFEGLALSIAIALVAAPGFILMYVRSRKAERAHKELLQNRARRRLEYVWMMIAMLFVLGYTISFVYGSLLKVLDFDAVTNESWPQMALKQLFTIAFIALGVKLVSRMTPGLPTKGGK